MKITINGKDYDAKDFRVAENGSCVIKGISEIDGSMALKPYKKEKPKTKIFQGTVRIALKECLDEGYFPATLKEIYDLKEEYKIDRNSWYDTSTLYFQGEIRTATLEELRNIEEIYNQGGRLLHLGGGGVGGDGDLDYDDSRFVGVLPEAEK